MKITSLSTVNAEQLTVKQKQLSVFYVILLLLDSRCIISLGNAECYRQQQRDPPHVLFTHIYVYCSCTSLLTNAHLLMPFICVCVSVCVSGCLKFPVVILRMLHIFLLNH